MAETLIRFPTSLRGFVGGRATLTVEAETARAALTRAAAEAQGLAERLFTPAGELRRHVKVYLGETDLLALNGLDTKLPENATLMIVQALAGG